MKKSCENCKYRFECMNFFCGADNDYEDFTPWDFTQKWQIESITVPFQVI